MSNKYTHTRKPHDIANGVRRRIRQLGAAREMLALEVIPDEFVHTFTLALEHLQFVQADLQAELNMFCEKYEIEDQAAPRGMR